MTDWFEWNGVRSTSFGIHVAEHPPITLPEERVTYTDVLGRSGSLTTLEGEDVYKDLLLTVTCFIEQPNRIQEIAAWLKGSGTVTFANRQGGFYYARVSNQIEFSKILRGNPHRSFSVIFRCKPFFYLSDASPINLLESSGVITNPGCVYSEPLITVYGTGEITLMLGSLTLELDGIEGSITMDSQLQEAYNGETTLNHCMCGEFLRLKPGHNAYSWTGEVTNIVIEPRWRTL